MPHKVVVRIKVIMNCRNYHSSYTYSTYKMAMVMMTMVEMMEEKEKEEKITMRYKKKEEKEEKKEENVSYFEAAFNRPTIQLAHCQINVPLGLGQRQIKHHP